MNYEYIKLDNVQDMLIKYLQDMNNRLINIHQRLSDLEYSLTDLKGELEHVSQK